MVKLRKGRRAYTPSSALGIMRFFDAESKAPKLSPELVVAIAIAFILIILVLHIAAL
ncbi:MAG: preprotein translocase subunit Sec61beta [Candidatus Iainarchaeum archaeon]|uniref:Preprotein translocase subunit Sec61beta n=1 Tax=Candidatus Iainarchaeum sp. TaxID=3101447 RepID=A0A497JGZ3_9ARCH|nr:MAG: preprotein translocase subunit Sec61beta [Candidatus Diapherotrites archaeon]